MDTSSEIATESRADEAEAGADEARERRNFVWYLAGVGSWFGMFGMQVVLFPWLVLIQLQETAARAGMAQMTLLLPGLMFILIGGAVADRLDRKRILLVTHTLGGLPALMLIWAILTDNLSYPLMLLYGIGIGTSQAFLFPARDGLLPVIARGNIQRAVTSTTMVQFGVQVAGFTLAGMAAITGAVPLLAVQTLVLWFGAIAFSRLRLRNAPPPAPDAATGRSNGFAMIRETAGLVWRTPALRDTIALVGGMGFFIMGCIFVGIPLIIRDIYGGDSSDLALINICNMTGMSLTAFVLLRRGGIVRQGRAVTCALGFGSLALAAIGFGLPYPAPLILMSMWGICGSITMSMGRTIVQEIAPEAHRSRAMAFYMLGFMGTAPFGSLIIGQLAEHYGALNAVKFSALGMTAVAILIGLRSPIWHMRPPGHTPENTQKSTAGSIAE